MQMASFSEAQARAWVESMEAQFGPQEDCPVAAAADAVEGAPVGGRFQGLIDSLIANLGNVSEEEAAAILAKITECTAAFASGNVFAGVLGLLAAFALYRKAIKD
jgi:hypothetical protein